MSYGVLRVAGALVLMMVACSDGSSGDETDGQGDDAGGGRDEPEEAADRDDTVVEPLRPGSFDAVIPRPVSVVPDEGEFPLAAATSLVVDDDADAGTAAELLGTYLRPVTELELPVIAASPGDDSDVDAGPRVIRFVAGDQDSLGEEGYELRITPDQVEVSAAAAPGFGWAVQTLRQLLPPEIAGADPVAGTFALPAGTVEDQPRFAWRGTMLDVSRHFFPPADVERVIDIAAAYKLNILHLHLSDDQGWRLEIAEYPELTEVGGSTEVGGGAGGFYTQEEYAELVAYSADRGVTVVPEIDMPGHTNAALASIPELNCDGEAPPAFTGMEVGFSSLCIDKELTYEFVDQVVAEVAALTPGPYIHIGGDESHATEPDDYVRFIERAADIVRSHGKIPVGWDEIGTAELGSDAVAQHWLSGPNTSAASAQGMDVVMSPAASAYLDMKYNDASPFGNSWAGLIDTQVGYEWDPATAVEGVPEDAVAGLEAPLWTEFVTTAEEVQLMVLPRLPGYAELGWSPADGNVWEEYQPRLAAHAARWDALGWTYTRDPVVVWE